MAMKVVENVLALDELYPQVKDFVIECSYASISQIQRKFRIGFNHASRIVEQLESNGVISSMNEEGLRLSRIVTDEQQAWWDALPVIWKKIFTTHIYHGDKLFTSAKQFHEPSAEIELRCKTDLIQVFCLTEIGFYKGPSLDYIPDLRYFNRLKDFSIRHRQIVDIRSLAQCKSLRKVSLPFNQIRDISPLFELPLLEEVLLVGNPIADETQLSALLKKVEEQRTKQQEMMKVFSDSISH
ncbi:TPA: hypothetical protein R4328_001922 [Pasteurella multocida]|uniref:DNA translocase FtsK n=1 Tax=Pasteurella multocida TaxID=747 RepID=UPI00233FECE4|nr:DNA translocase FtsK [Pasteurella multocida]MDC4237502.1 hypothetical protein [Pasteurella multocida]HDR1546672.1 hypothetical protein [Pasteurella multocida]HDR1549194.1 hypothetical protein [Pasteurella multocida]HDR1886516.1 hypothetical protein [Pasteurella multocida]HDV7289653.1 hypothetical protein [Pasteurella multocida]